MRGDRWALVVIQTFEGRHLRQNAQILDRPVRLTHTPGISSDPSNAHQTPELPFIVSWHSVPC